MGKINFLTYGFNYHDSSGGLVALHQLAHLLAKQGQNSYIYSDKTFKGSSARIVSNIDFLRNDNTMVIYPEVINGNPLNIKNVTRWLLNTPGKLGGDGIYNDNDLIFKYYDYFKAPNESKVNGELRTYNLKLDIFYNKNYERSGDCYIIKKGRDKVLDKHKPEDINIDEFISDEYLSEVFNKSERFICYDSMCFHLQQAALCGCIPVVIPDDNISKEEFVNKAPVNKYGIAYGFEDIDNAKNSLHLVKDYLQQMENESFELIKKYIECCYNKIKQ